MSKLTEKEKEIARLSINDIINSTELPEMIDSDLNKVDKVLDKSSISDLTETYDGIKNRAHIKAVRTIDSLLRFYLSEEIIEEEEYIRAKVEMDKMAQTMGMLFDLAGITEFRTVFDVNEIKTKMEEVKAQQQEQQAMMAQQGQPPQGNLPPMPQGAPPQQGMPQPPMS